MKTAAFSKLYLLSVLLIMAAFFGGCQDERKPGPDQGRDKAAAPAGAMKPADNQGATVPEGQALELLRFGPEGRVRKLNQVVAMFNQPMVALGGYDNVPDGALNIDPPLEGRTLWLNQYTLAFVPKEPLIGSLDLSVKLDPSALKALSGATLAEGVEIQISLPELAEVDRHDYSGNARDLDQALRPKWQINFNQPVDFEDLKSRAVFVYQAEGGEARVPALVTKEYQDIFFHFQPQDKLPPDTDYRLLVPAGLKSLAGPKPGPELTVAEGSTYGPLAVKLDLPSEKTLPPENGLLLSFNNSVDLAEILPLIHLDNGYDMAPLIARFAKPSPQESPAEEPAEAEDETAGDEYENSDNIRTYLYIPGGFKPDTEYTLTVDGSARDIFGQSLGQAFSRTFSTGEYQTYLDLGGEYGLMETASESKLRLRASNIKEARIQGYPLTAEQAVRFLSEANQHYRNGNILDAEKLLGQPSPLGTILAVPGGAKNGQIMVPVDLKTLFGDQYKERFLYLRTAWQATDSSNKARDRHTFAMVQVSDIGLAIKIGPESSLVWTTDLSKGQAWPEVRLELLDDQGRQLWSGVSGEDGLAALPGSADILEKVKENRTPGLFVIARAAGQMALWDVNWTEGLETWRWNIDFDSPMSRSPQNDDWLLNALPLYKPGETAKFKIIARRSRGDQLLDLGAKKLRVVVRDAQNQEVADEALTVGPFGTASYELKIPAGASLGGWSVLTSPDDREELSYLGDFMVMTYRPPALEIKFEDKPQEAVVGDEVAIKAKADYHFGAPVAGQPVRYSVSAAPADFRLPGTFSAYSVINRFRPAGEDDDSDYEYSEPSVTAASDETSLDQEGRLSFKLSLTPAPDQRPRPRNYQTYLTVTDVDQRQVSANSGFLVHPAKVYAGLHSDSFVAEAGRPYTLKVIAATPQGTLVADQKITATLYRRTWQNVRRKTAGAAYEYVSRMVDEKVAAEEISSKGDLPVELKLNPEKGGYHWVLAEIKDVDGRLNQAAYDFYVSGGGPVGWRMGNDDSLALVPDKQEYRPGETARIMVQSPFDQGQGLLTVERGGVRQSRVFTIENQTPVLEVPLTEDDTPNVFVSVLLARGRIADKLDEKGLDFGKPAIRLGYVELKVPSKKELLGVTVTPNLAEVGPGGEVEVAVAVTDHQGRPFSEAEVALIAADAAVVQLGGDETYFPEGQYHRDRPLLVQTADNLISLIGRQSLGEKGGNPGGGGGDMPMAALRDQDGGVRRNFASLAWFEPGLTLDENGRATVKMKMPENLTTFKIYAVATGHGRLTGTGQNSVLVSRDLLARSALPGYAGVGDEFLAAMAVSNRGKNSGRATVKLAGENFDILGGVFEKTVDIKAGESQEVAFRVKAGPAAEAKFNFTVTMGPDEDSVEFVIPVSPANQPSTQASYERLEPGQWRTDLALTEGLDLSRGGVELELSPSLVGVLTEPFAWMLAYPHGCVEQTTSRAYASLVWLDLKDRLNGSQEEARAAHRDVDATLAKLTRWDQDGGYNYWPEIYDWGNRSVYLSAYVLDFLLSAREAGFELPDPSLIGRIGAFLKKSLSSDYQWPAWFSDRARRETRSYVLAMLSRAGENVAAYVEIEYKNRAELSLFEVTNLIRALGHQQRNAARAGQIKTLLPLMANHIQVTAGEIQFLEPDEGSPEIWPSAVRTSAMALIALCQTAPDHDLIPALARYMVSASRSGHFGSTQNNALGLSALATYVQVMEPENPDLEISALLGSTSLAQARFKAFTDPAARGEAPLTAIPKNDPVVVYDVTGRGQAWAALKMKTAPAEPDLSAASSGGFILSRTFAVVAPQAGSPGVSSFKRGETVKVTVTMLAPVPRNNVVLLDRVPAGLEPVNFRLGDADLTLKDLAGNDDDGDGWGAWYNHQEIWPDRVAVYADRLSAGVYTFSYLARAVTVGEYLTPGPRAEEMYAPETFGRGEGQTLTVTE